MEDRPIKVHISHDARITKSLACRIEEAGRGGTARVQDQTNGVGTAVDAVTGPRLSSVYLYYEILYFSMPT